jgi:CHAD domain-containing protein
MVQALKLTSRRNERRLLQELAPVRKKAGKVRDMDVLTGFSATLHPDEEQCLIELLEYLGAERYRQCRKLRTAVQRRRGPIRRRLNLLSKFVDKRLRVARKHSDGGTEWPIDAMAVALKLSNELSRWPTLNSVNLHPYRLKVKELLYVLQLARKADEYFVKTLAQVKDAIGEWHDWQELARIAGKALHHQSQCNLLKQIRTRVQTTFEHAVEIANKMRKQSLKGSASLMFSSPLAESSARARLKSER